MKCGRGFYASEGSMSCDECPVGFYCPLLVTASPQPCASGFYANETKSVSCIECDRGKLFIALLFFICPDFTMASNAFGRCVLILSDGFFNMILKTEVMLGS